MGDLMQQGGGGSRKSVGAEELEILAVPMPAWVTIRDLESKSKWLLIASALKPSTLTCLVLF
jgi:hypothetical protein